MKVTVEQRVLAPVEDVWRAYTSPEDIVNWNAASDDWHTTHATSDLRVGGAFSSRMESKDGSAGFDFAGTYTVVEACERIEYEFGGRHCLVEFSAEDAAATVVRVTFDAEQDNPVDMQREGWQAILDNFASYVEPS